MYKIYLGRSRLALFSMHIAVTPAWAAHEGPVRGQPSYQVSDPFENRAKEALSVSRFAKPEALFGRHSRVSIWLRRHGIGLLVDSTNEFAGAVTSPTKGLASLRQGASNAGQYAVSLNVDWERIAGLRGFATHTVFIGRYGTTANRMFGDWLSHASEVYGGGGNTVVHLVMAYGEKTMFHGHMSLAAGRMSEMADFISSPLYCAFQNNAMCGRPKGATENAFASAPPVGVWAFRAWARPSPDTYVQSGVYAAEKGLYHYGTNRSGFKFNGSWIQGVRIPAEFGWEPLRRGRLAGHYKIGGVLTTAPQTDMLRDAAGRPYVLSGLAPRQHRASYGAWFLADQKIMAYRQDAFGRDTSSGLTVLSGFLYNDKRVALRNWQAFVGAISRGFFKARAEDTVALSFSYTAISPEVRKTQRLLRAQGKILPFHATGIQHSAIVMEMNYGLHVASGILFQPMVEFYHRPNGQENLRDAVLLGFKTHVEFL